MTTRNKPVNVRYCDMTEAEGRSFLAITMAPEQRRINEIMKLYPEYTYDTEVGPLENWIRAIAHDNEIPLPDAREAVRQMSDPIWNGNKAKVIGSWIWFLA